jgi:hypothetical protein
MFRRLEQERFHFHGEEVVTICIAAVLPASKRVVLVSDKRMSGSWTSVEAAFKYAILDSRNPWAIMFAGHTPEFEPVTRFIQGELRKYKEPAPVEKVIEFCEAAQKARIVKRIETEVLQNFALSRDEFVQRGREYFGQELFNSLAQQIRDVRSDVYMLVAGFGPDNFGRVFEVSFEGIVTRHDQLLFGAIGDGKIIALGNLYTHSALCHTPRMAEVLYRLLAAKFASESAPTVGPQTIAMILSPGGQDYLVPPERIDSIRSCWLQEGRRGIPEEALKVVESNVMRVDEWIALGRRDGK